jgi:hypothetical protein
MRRILTFRIELRKEISKSWYLNIELLTQLSMSKKKTGFSAAGTSPVDIIPSPMMDTYAKRSGFELKEGTWKKEHMQKVLWGINSDDRRVTFRMRE